MKSRMFCRSMLKTDSPGWVERLARLTWRWPIACSLWITALPSPEAATTNVSYGAFFFNPKVVNIQVGDTVNWTAGSGFHTLQGTSGDPICGGGTLPCSHTFNTAGRFAYHCTVGSHASFGMTGLVVVASAPIVPPVLTNQTRLPDGTFQFTVTSSGTKASVIQASTDLSSSSNWTPVSTNTTKTNVFVFTDTNAPALSLRFYRVSEN